MNMVVSDDGISSRVRCRLVRSFCPAAANGEGFVVQMTYQPRLRSGLRAVLDDADDIGWLSFTDEGVVFEGDSTRFKVPYESIESWQPQNVGLRGLYVYGRRLELKVRGMSKVQSVLLAERSSWVLPGSRRNTRCSSS